VANFEAGKLPVVKAADYYLIKRIKKYFLILVNTSFLILISKE